MVSSLVPPKVASPNAIGGAADAARMQRVVSFYEKLPRGPAPQAKARGPLEWYSLRYMTGRNPSVMRMSDPRCDGNGEQGDANAETALFHILGGFIILGYAQNYYFHLRKFVVLIGW
ncbi:ATP synthase f chain, mitochondrial precursor [Recurvomyces mirabilis]|nr:ATP synthase f chain, mitochondrial precursor [Recurvomyces mirabilis]